MIHIIYDDTFLFFSLSIITSIVSHSDVIMIYIYTAYALYSCVITSRLRTILYLKNNHAYKL